MFKVTYLSRSDYTSVQRHFYFWILKKIFKNKNAVFAKLLGQTFSSNFNFFFSCENVSLRYTISRYWNNGKNLDIGDTKRVAGENLDRFFSLKKTSYPNTIAKFFLFLSENYLPCIHPYYSKRNFVRFCRLEKSKKFGTWQKANARLSYCHEFENIPPSNKSIAKSMITTVSLQIPKCSHIFSWHCPLKFLNSLTVIGRIKTYFVSSKWK